MNSLIALGLANGLLLSLALACMRVPNRTASRRLATLVVALTAIIASELAGRLSGSLGSLLTHVAINFELVIGPLLILWARALTGSTSRPSARVLFSPFVLGVLIWVAVWSMGLKSATHRGPEPPEGLVTVFVAFKAIFSLGCIGLAAHELRRAGRTGLRLSRDSVGFDWLYAWTLGFGALAIPIYVTFFASRLGLRLPFDSDQLGVLVLAVMIYLLAAGALLRPGIFSVSSLCEAETTPEELRQLALLIRRERLHRDPEVSLRALAARLDWSPNRLSRVLNQGLSKGFRDFINEHRLDDFEAAATSPGADRSTVLDLALEVGFNSKASFYRAFRRRHSMTPSAWLEGRAERSGSSEFHPSR